MHLVKWDKEVGKKIARKSLKNTKDKTKKRNENIHN